MMCWFLFDFLPLQWDFSAWITHVEPFVSIIRLILQIFWNKVYKSSMKLAVFIIDYFCCLYFKFYDSETLKVLVKCIHRSINAFLFSQKSFEKNSLTMFIQRGVFFALVHMHDQSMTMIAIKAFCILSAKQRMVGIEREKNDIIGLG